MSTTAIVEGAETMLSSETWEADTAGLLDRVRAQHAQAQATCEALGREVRALSAALGAYRAIMQLPVTRGLRLDSKEIAGLTQRAILRRLASRCGNVLVVADAVKAMTAAGVFGNPDHANSAVCAVLMRSPEFVRVERGIYRLQETP